MTEERLQEIEARNELGTMSVKKVTREEVRELISEVRRLRDPSRVMVPRETLQQWREDLSPHWFYSDEEEEDNNDEIIAMSRAIDDILGTARS